MDKTKQINWKTKFEVQALGAWSIYKLQAKRWISNPSSKLSFIISFLFMVVFGSIIISSLQGIIQDPENAGLIFMGVISSVISMMIISTSMFGFGNSFIEMKKSVLLRRIGATKINKPTALIGFILWGLTILFLVIIWVFILSAIMGGISRTITLPWGQIRYGELFLAILIAGFAYYGITLVLISFSKNSEVYGIFAILFFFASTMLSGAFVFAQEPPTFMRIIGYLTPFAWYRQLIGASLVGENYFQMTYTTGYSFSPLFGLVAIQTSTGALNISMPLLYGGVFYAIALKTFKWDS